MSNILVTGATGFVGDSLIKGLDGTGHHIRATYRDTIPRSKYKNDTSVDWVKFNIEANNNEYKQILKHVDIVIHLAARVHAFDTQKDALEIYRKINSEGTRRLAEEAAKAGVRRFIFVSTIKVNGEKTLQLPDGSYLRFSEFDSPKPEDAYAISKYEAEESLMEICRESDLEYVILRPPLLYGPHVRANFLSLLRAVDKGYPLPFASINNMRSLLYVGNLAHAIVLCINKSEAANQIYLLHDIDISVPDLLRKLAACMGKKTRLITCPVCVLKILGKITGKGTVMNKITDPLVVDSSEIERELAWKPIYNPDDMLRETVDWYLNQVC